ncbi:hypothetical protein JR316_0000853 [Psilocybe cubensis]|uniref:Uncharacterized protein n=2 Tax=Psilocybe cubensis TaxID=181762 RepID=A0ACB8HFV6_PSICU|nr:hypothetical protein JR316_0000853 [Psilocybe cubensis]KAH9486788.1 hypothetical protein JR316_0000853 [Psilocybe cubensis]
MAPKRKSDAMQVQPHGISEAVAAPLTEEIVLQPSNKKARVTEISAELKPLPSSSKDNAQSWKDIKLDGEDEGEVPV